MPSHPVYLFTCAYCGAVRDRMTIWRHPSRKLLFLCFMVCQFRLEPFTATGLSNQWTRSDPWQDVSRKQPRLSEPIRIARASQRPPL